MWRLRECRDRNSKPQGSDSFRSDHVCARSAAYLAAIPVHRRGEVALSCPRAHSSASQASRFAVAAENPPQTPTDTVNLDLDDWQSEGYFANSAFPRATEASSRVYLHRRRRQLLATAMRPEPSGATLPCPAIARKRLSERAQPSTEWEAASRTQPLFDRSGKAHDIPVKEGGWRRNILKFA